jgi:nucleoid DNA-binding protein
MPKLANRAPVPTSRRNRDEPVRRVNRDEPRRARREEAEEPVRNKTRTANTAPAARKKTRAAKVSKYAEVSPIREALNRTAVVEFVSDYAEVDKATAKLAIEAVCEMIVGSVMKKGVGKFIMPGLFKVVTINKLATKARKGIMPGTGEPTMFKARPARTVVKIRPLKDLKDAVLGN